MISTKLNLTGKDRQVFIPGVEGELSQLSASKNLYKTGNIWI